jgi:hypothetical protein
MKRSFGNHFFNSKKYTHSTSLTMYDMRTIMKLLMIGSCLSFFQCTTTVDPTDSNTTEACGVKDPIQNLDWLHKRIYDRELDKVGYLLTLYEYNQEQVLEIKCSLFSSTNLNHYYCDGKELDLNNSEIYKKYLATRKKIKVLNSTDLIYKE